MGFRVDLKVQTGKVRILYASNKKILQNIF